MFEHSPSDRMQLVGMGDLLHPGCCLHCGSGNCEQGYINLDVFHEMEGSQYLCVTCLKQAAEIIGCLIPEEAQHLQETAERLATENATLFNQLGEADERLNAYDTLLKPLVAIHADADSVPVESGNESGAAPGATTSVAVAGEPESPKPVAKSRRNDSNGTKSGNASRRESRIEL